ncbi:MAG: hypothetical protein HNEKOMLI_00775 [Sodalis sp. Psp]|nr:hypothetical protein [Sodalis sp. Psp]MCR3757247.1 hypothetical protein [Sodalis sp. Ppy]
MIFVSQWQNYPTTANISSACNLSATKDEEGARRVSVAIFCFSCISLGVFVAEMLAVRHISHIISPL